MRIVHCCFACFYIDRYAYQENLLPLQNFRDGHEVMILASTQTFENGREAYLEPGSYINEYGIPVVRLPYVPLGPKQVTRRLKKCAGITEQLEAFKPELIYLHGLCSLSNPEVMRYAGKHPEVCVLSDTHADANNSGTNWVSLHLLHRIIWRSVVYRLQPGIEKIYCISDECLDFARENFLADERKLVWFPLGVVCPTQEEYAARRQERRKELGIGDDTLLFVHSGKMDKQKRTPELLDAFAGTPGENMRLVIAGGFLPDIKEEAEKKIAADKRVTFIGWQNQEQLTSLLCAADVYVQPGSQSATMQNALGCGCAEMLYPHKSHIPYLKNGNGWFVETQADMKDAFAQAAADVPKVRRMGEISRAYALETLDYSVLAKQMYADCAAFKKRNGK